MIQTSGRRRDPGPGCAGGDSGATDASGSLVDDLDDAAVDTTATVLRSAIEGGNNIINAAEAADGIRSTARRRSAAADSQWSAVVDGTNTVDVGDARGPGWCEAGR